MPHQPHSLPSHPAEPDCSPNPPRTRDAHHVAAPFPLVIAPDARRTPPKLCIALCVLPHPLVRFLIPLANLHPRQSAGDYQALISSPVFSPTLELRERAWPLALAVAGGLQILRNTRLPAPDGQPSMPTRLSAFILLFLLEREPSRCTVPVLPRHGTPAPPSLPPPLVPKIPTDKSFADGPGHALSPPGMLLSVFAGLLPALLNQCRRPGAA
ncbi:hypothetical protein HETIRDRAFT_451400 [Heterobasidion irregulare TC 32-1]|uniref:Uncharacterized protein n=1 Tax=Heterobasidion irregulare (strain TC 32-1) TaxID=747525 RepID=W4K784_HETIT|nr:uncharacterized protein HETIRDRAFT_451400 [Heterobasidion irregulare TC 32-1]ETW81663.1 hypothetical protein HETIRDRAFT_451400 [Heterobasidion irregulare TC 32-1]